NNGRKASFSEKKGFIPFEGGSKKFTIKFDEVSNCYWTITNYIDEKDKIDYKEERPARLRNTLALLSSADLKKWNLRKILIHSSEVKKEGFQYVDFSFEE